MLREKWYAEIGYGVSDTYWYKNKYMDQYLDEEKLKKRWEEEKEEEENEVEADCSKTNRM